MVRRLRLRPFVGKIVSAFTFLLRWKRFSIVILLLLLNLLHVGITAVKQQNFAIFGKELLITLLAAESKIHTTMMAFESGEVGVLFAITNIFASIAYLLVLISVLGNFFNGIMSAPENSFGGNAIAIFLIVFLEYAALIVVHGTFMPPVYPFIGLWTLFTNIDLFIEPLRNFAQSLQISTPLTNETQNLSNSTATPDILSNTSS